MSNNLVSQHLPVSSMQVDSVVDRADTSVLSRGMGVMGPMSNNSSSHQSNILNQQSVSVDPMLYISGSDSLAVSNMPQEQMPSIGNIGSPYIIVNEDVGEMEAIWNNLSAQNLSLAAKRKAGADPLPTNSPRQQSSMSNKRVAQMQPLNSPRLPQQSAPNKRSVQVHSSTPGSLNVPNKKMVRNESMTNRTGTQRLPNLKNKTAPAEPSPKVQAGSFEAVRSKMRETLAAALSTPNEEKSSPPQAANTPLQTTVDSQPAQSNVSPPPVGADGLSMGFGDNMHSTSLIDKTNGCQSSSLETLGNAAQMGKADGQESQFNYVLPDADGPFNDSFFVKDELLQGNGLSWAWDMDLVEQKVEQTVELIEEKVDQTAKKLEHAGAGGGGVEKVLCSPQELASKIEAELFKLFGGVNKKYKEKGRSLMFNLKDRNNPELRERVVSGEISAEKLCSMTPEELASKELSEWRTAKAEELAQMKVLPDSDGNVRRLVKKTHKGEYQVEVEQDDGVSVEVSVGSTSFSNFRPKPKEKAARPTSEVNVVKEKESGEKSIRDKEDPSCRFTIPADGADPMQELILDECKNAELGPPRSFEEFIQDLAVDDPFPEGSGQLEVLSDKENAEIGDELKSNTASMDPVKDEVEKTDKMYVKPTKLLVNVTTSESPAERKFFPSGSATPAERKFSPVSHATPAEHVWEGELQLTLTSLVRVVGLFRSGEKTSTKEWPGLMEIKGRVRLDAFEKFLQELPMSRSRAVMVVHFVLKGGASREDRESLTEAVDSYVLDERLGFGEPIPGVELYFCPPHPRILELLSRQLVKDQTDLLKSTDNGLIGVVVWRRPHISSAISPNSSSSHHHHKHGSKKQNFQSRRQEDKNVNMNLTSKPSMPFVGQPPLNNRSRPPPPLTDDDDDDVPPGFGPGSVRDEDDLPEFNFSGNLNSSKLPAPKSLPLGSAIVPPRPSGRPVDQMRELVYKYGQQSGTSAGSKNWNEEDDDDIPEWQPQLPIQSQPPVAQVVQQPLRPHLYNQPLTPTTPTQSFVQIGQPQIVMQPPVNAMMQNSIRYSGGQQQHVQPNARQYYGSQWQQGAPRERGY